MHPTLVRNLIVTSKVIVTVRFKIRRGRNQIIQFQPLGSKTITEVLYAMVIKHAIHLFTQDLGVLKLSVSRQLE